MNTNVDRIRREPDRTRLVGIEYPHSWVVAGEPGGAATPLFIQFMMIFGFGPLIFSRTTADAQGLTDWQYGFLPHRWPWSDITGFSTQRKVRNGEEGEIITYPISVAVHGQWEEMALRDRDQVEAETFIAALSARRP